MRARTIKEDRQTSQRVSQRKKRAVLSKKLVNYILGRLENELIHDFGYDYSENHKWGKHSTHFRYEDAEHLLSPPYGTSLSTTKQAGLQLNHKYDKFMYNIYFNFTDYYLSKRK